MSVLPEGKKGQIWERRGNICISKKTQIMAKYPDRNIRQWVFQRYFWGNCNFNEIEPKERSAVPQRLKRKWGGGGGSDLVRWFKNLFSHHTIKFFTRLPLPHPPTQVRSWKWNGYQKTLEFYNRKNSDFFHCFVRINFISQYFSWKMKQR